MLVLLTALSCISGLLFGFDTGIISGALVLLKTDFNLTDVEEELVVSLTVVGALVSSLFAGTLGDRFGRKPVVLASAVAFIAGATLMGLTRNYYVLLLGRFVVGLGVGTASLIVPVYLAECAPAEHRGSLVSCVNVSVTFGQLLACIVAGLFSEVTNGWRYMLGLAGIPAVLQLVGFGIWVPESPRYLLQAGQIDVGTNALRKLRGRLDVRDEVNDILDVVRAEDEALWHEAAALANASAAATANASGKIEGREFARLPAGAAEAKSDNEDGDSFGDNTTNPISRDHGDSWDVERSDLSLTHSLIQKTLQTQPNSPQPHRHKHMHAQKLRPSMWTLISKVTTWRALILGSMLQAGNQFAGINTVMYFGATIFTLGGSSHSTAIWLTVGLSACNFIGSTSSFYMQDRLGRRLLTNLSMLGVSLSLLLIAGMFYATEKSRENDSATAAAADDNKQGGGGGGGVTSSTWLIFGAICLYLLLFAAGMGSTPWTVCAEIYPTSVRGAAVSITTSVNWTATLVVSMTFLSTVRLLTEGGAFLTYSAISFMFFLFYYFYLPETKGVALEQIPPLFQDDRWGKEHHKSCFLGTAEGSSSSSSSSARGSFSIVGGGGGGGGGADSNMRSSGL